MVGAKVKKRREVNEEMEARSKSKDEETESEDAHTEEDKGTPKRRGKITNQPKLGKPVTPLLKKPGNSRKRGARWSDVSDTAKVAKKGSHACTPKQVAPSPGKNQIPKNVSKTYAVNPVQRQISKTTNAGGSSKGQQLGSLSANPIGKAPGKKTNELTKKREPPTPRSGESSKKRAKGLPVDNVNQGKVNEKGKKQTTTDVASAQGSGPQNNEEASPNKTPPVTTKIIIPKDLNSSTMPEEDPKVDEASSKKEAGMALHDIYGWFFVNVSIDEIEDPANKLRCTNRGKKGNNKFDDDFAADMYGHTGAYISICMYELAGEDIDAFRMNQE